MVLAGCGASSRRSAATARYGPKSSPASLSRCMRANGLSGFPDPEAGPSGAVGLPLMVNSDGSLTAENQTFAGPALRRAELACKIYLPPAGGPPAPSPAQQRRALAFARCMRANGVPSFPDPTSSGHPVASGTQLSVSSPAFKSAAKTCGAGGAVNFSIAG